MRIRAVAAALALVALAGCSSESDSASTTASAQDVATAGREPVVDQILPAVAALEDLLGGPQEYVEINADTRMVFLLTFDAASSTATAYRYLEGEVTVASEPFEISGGAPLRAEWINFDPEVIFSELAAQVPQSEVIGFVILAGPGETVTYEAFLQSRQGGQLVVGLGPEGQVLSVQAL